MCWKLSTNQNTHSIHVICVTVHKMADGREDDREATFQFIEEVQNCPDLWDVLSAAYKDTKSKQKNGRASRQTNLACVVI